MRNRQTTCTLISEQHDIKIPSINCTILSCIWSYHIPHCRWNSVCCGSCRIHLENHHRSISTYKFWCSGTSLRSGQHAYVASSLIDYVSRWMSMRDLALTTCRWHPIPFNGAYGETGTFPRKFLRPEAVIFNFTIDRSVSGHEGTLMLVGLNIKHCSLTFE